MSPAFPVSYDCIENTSARVAYTSDALETVVTTDKLSAIYVADTFGQHVVHPHVSRCREHFRDCGGHMRNDRRIVHKFRQHARNDIGDTSRSVSDIYKRWRYLCRCRRHFQRVANVSAILPKLSSSHSGLSLTPHRCSATPPDNSESLPDSSECFGDLSGSKWLALRRYLRHF